MLSPLYPSQENLTAPKQQVGRTHAVALNAIDERSSRVASDHLQEWLESGVDPDIVLLNVETLTDTATDPNADSLFPVAERLNWNITRFGHQGRSYLRGWWVNGIDPFTWQPMTWGRFKPDGNTPVLDRQKDKPAKYLSPSLGANSSRLMLLQVSDVIWQRVAQRCNTPISFSDRQMGFWHWVWQHQVPVVLTEGEKKAGCLLSQGYAAIALPGIFNGYRKDTRQLIPDLARFALADRQIYICFDFETRPKTLKNVNLAIAKLGKLLQNEGCHVKVIELPGPQKGVDDFVVDQGSDALHLLYHSALDLEFWETTKLWTLTYPPTLILDQPHLENLPYPATGLACIKSPKGTGKTTALQSVINQAIRIGRKVLVITHRIQLGRAICQDIGIDWIEGVRESETQGLFGYGLCIDSLHSVSQARFNPQSWKGAIVILDEVEQVLWHMLNSSTCYEHRAKIIETLRELVQVVLENDGLIIAQDADLSDVSVEYLLGLTKFSIEPWIAVNQWRPEKRWEVFFYNTKSPAPLLTRMGEFLENGAIYVALDSQKARGKWSSKNLEFYLQTHFPDKRILRIDSESVADPEHPACGMVERLNQVIVNYDIVLATPTIGTGVSIDVCNHFKAVFGIFQGVTPDAESRQALARVRESVPRLIWATPFGPAKIGNGSCSYQDVAASTTRAVNYNIALLRDIDFDIDKQTDPITLRTWAKMAARVNTSLWQFRHRLQQGLQLEGHQVTIVTNDVAMMLPPEFASLCTELTEMFGAETIAKNLHADLESGILCCPGFEFLDWRHDPAQTELVIQEIAVLKQNNRYHEAVAISTADDISEAQYRVLRDQRAKTQTQRYVERKYELQRRYGIEITPDVNIRDDKGWYAQLRLHYYLTHDPAFVHLRDTKEWQGHLTRGEGKVILHDVRLLTAQVEALRNLDVLPFLDANREIRATDVDVQQMVQHCVQCSSDIKTIFNLTVSDKMTPVEIVQALLAKMGLKLTCVGRDRTEDGRRGGIRVYQYQDSGDGRQAIFAQWRQRDEKNQITELTVLSADFPEMGFDPPLDIYALKQSTDGSKQVAEVDAVTNKAVEVPCCIQSDEVRLLEGFAIGSVIKLIEQAGYWTVLAITSTAVKLKQLGGDLEYSAALNELGPSLQGNSS